MTNTPEKAARVTRKAANIFLRAMADYARENPGGYVDHGSGTVQMPKEDVRNSLKYALNKVNEEFGISMKEEEVNRRVEDIRSDLFKITRTGHSPEVREAIPNVHNG